MQIKTIMKYHLHLLEWTSSKSLQTINSGNFPGGPVVENPLCDAQDTGLIPGRETRIPHTMEQLSLNATMRDPACCHEDLRQPDR